MAIGLIGEQQGQRLGGGEGGGTATATGAGAGPRMRAEMLNANWLRGQLPARWQLQMSNERLRQRTCQAVQKAGGEGSAMGGVGRVAGRVAKQQSEMEQLEQKSEKQPELAEQEEEAED